MMDIREIHVIDVIHQKGIDEWIQTENVMWIVRKQEIVLRKIFVMEILKFHLLTLKGGIMFVLLVKKVIGEHIVKIMIRQVMHVIIVAIIRKLVIYPAGIMG